MGGMVLVIFSEGDYSVRHITVYGMLHTKSDFPWEIPGMKFGIFGFLRGAEGPGMAINGRLRSGGFRCTEYRQNPGFGKPIRDNFPVSSGTM